MKAGLRFGSEGLRSAGKRPPVLLAAFLRDDGGYTTVAVAVALLVSFTLVFSAASSEWALARAAEVQYVADAAAMAGDNCVAGFSTIVQVVDACVLSMGLAGSVALGAGLVLSTVPLMAPVAKAVIQAGNGMLDMRRSFSTSAAGGLRHLESALPALVAASSASCISANSQGGIEYVGCAVPFPLASETDYSFLQDELSGEEMTKQAEKLQEVSARKAAAHDRADKSKERAWKADNIDDPACMRTRAASLAGLAGALNPFYTSAASWRFDYARLRAKNYYVTRLRNETPQTEKIEEAVRSAARERFYRYAARVIGQAVCQEDGATAMVDLPELPHTTEMVRASELYVERVWPCTLESEGPTLHGSSACPAAQGAALGLSCLADIDSGQLRRCSVCQMDAAAMGNVADASTNISNGFEHYWRIVVEESRAYQQAMQEVQQDEDELKELGHEGSDAFERAIELLRAIRPQFRPAGSYGCVAVVKRAHSAITPQELSTGFSSAGKLPAGMAISAATLAPEATSDGSNVLSQVFSGLVSSMDFGPVEVADQVSSLWGDLLVDYGSAYADVNADAESFLDGVGSLFGEKVASWLRSRMVAVVKAAGFEPADMRARKPVLVHTQQVLDEAGGGRQALSVARELLSSLPAGEDEAARMLADKLSGLLGSPSVTVAEIELPSGKTIPLTVDISKFWKKR